MKPNTNQKLKELKILNLDWEHYFKNTIIPQLFFDDDLILRKFTPPAMKQFSLTSADIGRSIHDVVNNLRYPSIIENINWVIETGEILEKEIQTTDLRWFQMNIIPNLQIARKAPNGVIITFVDITNRIKDLKEQEKIIADYETLLDTISHDVKNRLTGTMLSLEFLNASNLEDKEDVKSLIEIVDSGVKKIHLMIKELFDSRHEKHKYKAIDELLNVEHILEDVQLALINEIKNSKAKIKIEINSSEIVFPRRELRSIIFNLVSNAIKFRSPERNPEILIKTSQENNFMLLSIKDNGIGIASDKQKDIFKKFFRIENSIEGTGVGLHLVKTLITNAGGKLEIESQLEVGSEFKIYLKTESK